MFAQLLKGMAIDCQLTYSRILKFNDKHEPAGSSMGGQFAPKNTASTADYSALDKHLIDYKPERPLSDPKQDKAILKFFPNAKFVLYAETPFFHELNKLQGTKHPSNIESKDYAAARDKLFKKQKVETLKLKDLVFTQTVVNAAKVNANVDKIKAGGKGAIYVVQYKHEYYVMDGHHRAVATAMSGGTTVQAHVLKISAKKEDAFALILKFNPYHASDGKFTGPGGAVFVSLWGKNTADIHSPKNYQTKNNQAAGEALHTLATAAHLLGNSARDGGDISQSQLQTAQQAASTALIYGSNSSNYGRDRDNLRQLVANAFAKSGLPASEKLALKIPLTTEEKAHIDAAAKAAEAAKPALDKAGLKKLATFEKAYPAKYVELVIKAQAALANYKFKEADKQTAKITALETKYLAMGGTKENMAKLSADGGKAYTQHAQDAFDKVKALSVEYYKQKDKFDSMPYEQQYREGASKAMDDAKAAANDLFQANKGLIVQSVVVNDAQKEWGFQKSKLEADHIAALKDYSTTPGHDEAKFAKANATMEALKGAGYTEDKIKEINQAVAEHLDGQSQTGKPSVTAAQALQEHHDLPDKVAPASDKQTALNAAKDVGKQFYMLKEGGKANDSDLAKAHDLYEQAKQHYVDNGGSKEEFKTISADLKSQAQKEIQQEQDKKDSLKSSMGSAVQDSANKYHYAKLTGADPAVMATLKAQYNDAVNYATEHGKEVGLLKDNIDYYKGEGALAAETKYTTNKNQAASLIEKNAFAFASARLNGADTTKAGNDLYAAVNMFGSTLSKEDLAAAKAAGDAKAKSQFEALKAFKEATGDPAKILAQYDAPGAKFNYPDKNGSFIAGQVQRFDGLPQATKDILETYTSTGYKGLNKAIGGYTTKLLAGETPKPLSATYKSQVTKLDAAFAQMPLGEPVALRRNMPQQYFWEQLGIHDYQNMSVEKARSVIGKVYKETAYSSTSITPSFSGSYTQAGSEKGLLRLDIRAHPDVKGIWVDHISHNPGENEVVLGRGTTYVIRDVLQGTDKYGNFKWTVKVDALGTFPDKVEA